MVSHRAAPQGEFIDATNQAQQGMLQAEAVINVKLKHLKIAKIVTITLIMSK